jgi:hypothetical protein
MSSDSTAGPAVTPDRFNSDLAMREAVFFDGPNARSRYSRFWLLLILASIIASAGVVADSTATVIGAMIVAPLMTPPLAVVGLTLESGSPAQALGAFLLFATNVVAIIGSIVDPWAAENGWKVTDVSSVAGEVEVRLEGPLPLLEPGDIKSELVAAGIDTDLVTFELVPVYVVELK